MTWEMLVVDEKGRDETRTRVFLVDSTNQSRRLLAETHDHYEHLDACLSPGNARAILLKMQEIDGDRDEFIEVFDPVTLKPVISLTNWPVDKISFSKDGKLMFLQAKLETGTPIEAVLDLFRGDKVEGVSRAHDAASLVSIADLLKQRRRAEKKIS